MEVNDIVAEIIILAMDNLKLLVPALLVLSALAVADQMVTFVMNLITRASKTYKI